jgi:hypothetical protein
LTSFHLYLLLLGGVEVRHVASATSSRQPRIDERRAGSDERSI